MISSKAECGTVAEKSILPMYVTISVIRKLCCKPAKIARLRCGRGVDAPLDLLGLLVRQVETCRGELRWGEDPWLLLSLERLRSCASWRSEGRRRWATCMMGRAG